MIAGETENIISRGIGVEGYDSFSFFGKKKRAAKRRRTKRRTKAGTRARTKKGQREKRKLSPEEQEARRARRQQFWSNLGASLKEGGTVNNMLGMLKGNSGQAAPEDYQINPGNPDDGKPSEKKGIPVPVLIIGGLALPVIAYLLYQNYQSNQESKRLQS